MLSLICLTLAFIATCSTYNPRYCKYNGVTYKPGDSFKPWQCENCVCDSDGHLSCVTTECTDQINLQCADRTYDPERCCPYFCPNGRCFFQLFVAIDLVQLIVLRVEILCYFHYGTIRQILPYLENISESADTLNYFDQPLILILFMYFVEN